MERKGSPEAYSRSAGYAYDSLGRMVSCAEGADSESYAYDALGNRTLKTTGAGEDAWGDSLRFTAYPYDPVAGKHFAYARVYDGTLGRMYAKDPVKQGLNGYVYCDNDPADHTDPDGELGHIAVAALGGHDDRVRKWFCQLSSIPAHERGKVQPKESFWRSGRRHCDRRGKGRDAVLGIWRSDDVCR